jgi:hypothetical protein
MKLSKIFDLESRLPNAVKLVAAKSAPPLRIVAGVASVSAMVSGNLSAMIGLSMAAKALGKAHDDMHSRGWDELPLMDEDFKDKVSSFAADALTALAGAAAVGGGGVSIASGSGQGVAGGLILAIAGAIAIKQVADDAFDTHGARNNPSSKPAP